MRHLHDRLENSSLFGSYFCTGHVGNEPAQILIDEGGEISMVNPELIRQMPINVRPQIKPINLGILAFDLPLTVQGYVEIPITIAGITVQHCVVLIEEMETKNIDMLMGNDFTSRHDFHMRAYRKEAYFKGKLLTVYKTKTTSTRGRLVCNEEILVPSNGQADVSASLDGNPLCGPRMCAEQIPTWPYTPDIYILPGVVDISAPSMYIQVFNRSPNHIRVYKGEILTTLHATNQITSMSQQSDSLLHARFLQTCISSVDEQQLLSEPDFNVRSAKTTSVRPPRPAPQQEKSCSPSAPVETLEYDEIIALLPEYLQCMVKNVHQTLTPVETYQVVELLLEMEPVFHHPDRQLGVTGLLEHGIDIQGNHPIKQAPRRLPYHKLNIVKEELEKMLASNTIRPSISPWASPIVLVTKKDGTTRFCIDYRKLNDVTRKDAFPLPRIDECLDVLSGAKYFCTLDLASGYWQVGMLEDDKAKTAFCTKFGLYEFNVMPFGLCNAPATFERLTEYILAGMQWHEALVYIDDVVVFGSTFSECLARLREVFLRFKAHNLTFKPKKCVLFSKQVDFLGHVVSEDGVRCNPKKVEAIQLWEPPCTVTEIRSFLGMSGYYRKFLEHYADVSKPLVNLTKKDEPFTWSDKCQASFEHIKEALVTAPVLAYPDMSKPFILDTDASGFAAGAVLSQIQDDGEERPTAYYSKVFQDAEVNYCTTHRELLAVVLAVKAFRHYLLGKPFLIRTDHSSLVWLKNFKGAEGKIARWIFKLDEYDYTMQFRKGADHGNADAMSRMRVGTQTKEKRERLCKFMLCPDCAPKRSFKEVDILYKQIDLEKCAKDNINIQIRSIKATLEPRRSERVRTRRGRTATLQPGKITVSRTVQPTLTKPSSVPTSLGIPSSSVLEEGPKDVPITPPRRSKRIADQQQASSLLDVIPLVPIPSSVSPSPDVEETESTADQSELGPESIAPSSPLNSPTDIHEFVFSESHISGSDLDSDVQDTDDEIMEATDTPVSEPSPINPSNWFATNTMKETRDAQMKDPGIEQVIQWKEAGSKPFVKFMKTLHPTTRALYPQWNNLKLIQGVLYRTNQDSVSKLWITQLVVPESMRSEFFFQLHGSILGGHLGRTRTIESVRRKFYWPRYHADLKLWVKKCQICSEAKSVKQQHPRLPLKQKGAAAPFDVVSIDILTLTKTKDGNKYILMVIDSFSKWVEAYPLAEHSAPSVAKLLASRWMCEFGIPRELHSDRGAEFTGEVITHLCAALQIHKTKTPAYRPQANGQCERMNLTACKMLSSFQDVFMNEEWDVILPYLMSAYRRSVHESTGLTPNMMVFGRECSLPIEMIVGSPPDTPPCPNRFVQQIRELLQKAHAFARDKLDISAAKQKRNYDRYAGQGRSFQPGENVMYWYTPKNKKLSRPWEHYIVRRVLDEQPYAAIYEISKGEEFKPRPVHIDHLKPYTGDHFIKQWWTDPVPKKQDQGIQVNYPGIPNVRWCSVQPYERDNHFWDFDLRVRQINIQERINRGED